MKRLAPRRAGNRAVRADQPQVEAQRLRDGQRKLMAASGAQHDLDTGVVGAAQGLQIGWESWTWEFSRVPSRSMAIRRMGDGT